MQVGPLTIPSLSLSNPIQSAQNATRDAAAALAEKARQEAKELEEKAKDKLMEEAAQQAGMTVEQYRLMKRGTELGGGFEATQKKLVAFGVAALAFFKQWWWIIVPVCIAIGLLIYYFTRTEEDFQDGGAAESAAATAGDSLGAAGAAGDSIAPMAGGGPPIPPEEELTLVNSQAKTIKQAGYAGPPTGGKFDPEEMTAQALKAGFRAFVLQIDSVKAGMDPAAFPEAGTPTLLYRGDDGTLLSANAGSIESVAKMIAALAFRPEVPDYTLPVILYLHVLAAPSPIRAQEEYIRFLSRIARALNPLAPFHLGSTPMGVFHRQKRERDLLHVPIKSLEGQVIILSNADTTLFRAPIKGGKRYAPADDLDYWVNMRVNLDNDNETHGIAKVAEEEGGTGPAAVVVSLANILGLGAAKRDAFATRGKSRYVIAMPGAMKNPSATDLDRALKDLGVNMVPLDIFSASEEKVKKLTELYEGKPYKSKPAALRVRSDPSSA